MGFQNSTLFAFRSSLDRFKVISFLSQFFIIKFDKIAPLANTFSSKMRLNQIRMAQFSRRNGPAFDNEMEREWVHSAQNSTKKSRSKTPQSVVACLFRRWNQDLIMRAVALFRTFLILRSPWILRCESRKRERMNMCLVKEIKRRERPFECKFNRLVVISHSVAINPWTFFQKVIWIKKITFW